MRSRNWVVSGVLVLAVLAAALVAGHKRTGGGLAPRVSFGSQVQPVSASAINYVNGWTASAGAERIGVYAGSQRQDRRNGVFVVARWQGSRRRVKLVVLRRTGTLTLLRPSPPADESAALDATLHFVTASGSTGTLDLGNDAVSLNR